MFSLLTSRIGMVAVGMTHLNELFQGDEQGRQYLDQGTLVVWLIVSETREVLVCTRESKYSVRDTLTVPGLLPEFELPVRKIFEGLP